MKKTLNINVSGIIFHIDEDAYAKLNSYLESLKLHFQHVEGSKDIVDDIEARIAELLQGKVSPAKQVISLTDVDEIIGVMGRPSQFGEQDETGETPSSGETGRSTKRFYRDPDHKVIAGICSGIAAYLHWDPVIIRILFIVSLLAGGFGIFLYIIFWIVIPEAATTSEKLEMRGERVTISNIERSIQEEVSALKDQLKNLTQTTRDTLHRGGKSPSPIEQLVKGVVEVLAVVWRMFVIVVGIILVFIGISFVIALLALIFGWGGPILVDSDVLVMAFPGYLDLILGCSFNPFFIQSTLLILLGIPAILILYSGVKLIFRFEGIRYAGITLFNIWLIGLIIAGFYSFKIYNLVRADATEQSRFAAFQPSSDTIHLRYSDWEQLDELSLDAYEIFDNITIFTDQEKNYYLAPTVRIEAAKGDEVEVVRRGYARGKSVSEAKERINQIQYQLQQSGDTLLLDHFATFPPVDCWRGQKVMITIRIPVGDWVTIDRGVWQIESEFVRCTRDLDTGQTFRMTESGLNNLYE